MSRSGGKGTPGDPRGLIRESFRIDGITPADCRSVFLDWLLGLPDNADAKEEIRRLLELYASEADSHPMKRVLRDGLADPKPARRRSRRIRAVRKREPVADAPAVRPRSDASATGGQDMQGTASSKVLIENARTRVTEWRFAGRGDNTGWHRHEHDYVVVPLLDGVLELHEPDGQTRRSELRSGAPYFRPRGVEHDVANGNDFEYAFIEIEFLDS